jgi:hypothetical protein
MDINPEGIYYAILSDKPLVDEIFPDLATGYEDVPKEIIYEILVTYFGVDFGYDVEKWKKYIAKAGGWFEHYYEGGMYKVEIKVLKKHNK